MGEMKIEAVKAIEGLTEAEAARRLAEAGPNRIAAPREISFLRIAVEEITEPMILLLLVVGAVYTLWGKLEDSLTIFIVIVLLVLAEVLNEYRAKKAISSLAKITAPRARVVREGKIKEVGTEGIVPGDILVLAQGTVVAADGKVLVSYSLQADESSLTGESFPLDKNEDDELYAGTIVVSGEGKAVAVSTGRDTRIGKLSAVAREIKEPKTPLQLAMRSLSLGLVWVALAFSIAIPLLGYLRGQPLKEMILTGLALAFAVIPEELPIIITMVLGLGAYQLSKENFLVKKLRAAEVLGDATVILTDKTGTITENRMKVVSVYPAENERGILDAASGTLTDISLSPTDSAIAEACKDLGVIRESPVDRERSFSNERKTRSVLRKTNGTLELYMIGAPEEVMRSVRGHDSGFEKALRDETSRGRRVVAVARKPVQAADAGKPFVELEKDMDIVGIIGIEDPPRRGVRDTIEAAKRAGIRTVMVTGDHPLTAKYIAQKINIPDEEVLTGDRLDQMSDAELREAIKHVSVFARATPEHKYRLVRAFRGNGEIVAVTGDGINDALALKGADIGISMGIKGTDVAREAADVVLADDDFVTIARGIFEGRKFFDNLKKGLRYYLSVKTALILVFLLPVLFDLPMPLAPIQIILLELFMDLAASAGFVAEPAERSIYGMRPHTAKTKLFDKNMLKGIAISGLSLFAGVMSCFYFAIWQDMPVARAQTFAFTAWIGGHIFLAFVSRSQHEPLIRLGPFSNHVMDLWAIVAFSFLFIVLCVPAIGVNLHLTTITGEQFALIMIVSFVAIFWQELAKMIKYYGRHE